MIELWRDHERVAIIQCPHVDRDEALVVIDLTACAMDLDAVVLAVDARMRMQEVTDPLPEPGEYQRRVEADERGDIIDTVLVSAFTRSGDSQALSMGYEYADGGVRWIGDPVPFDATMTGFVARSVRQAFARKSIGELWNILDDDGVITPAMRDQADTVVLVELLSRGYHVAARVELTDEAERHGVTVIDP